MDGASRYVTWQQLFKSRAWYAISISAFYNKKMANWQKGYVYRSIKALLGIKQKVSATKLLRITLDLTPDDFVKKEFEVFAARWLLKQPPSERNYGLVGFDALTTDSELQSKS
jgi:hypothetical protein